jgi:hypothetical protein
MVDTPPFADSPEYGTERRLERELWLEETHA